MRPSFGGRVVIKADAAELRARSALTIDPRLRAAYEVEGEASVHLRVEGEFVEFPWGKPHELGTACYWVEQTRRLPSTGNYQLGDSLREEVAACLLASHGVPAAIGLAAFDAVRDEGLLREGAVPRADAIEAVLRRPVDARGRRVHYRFPRRRAKQLAACLEALAGAAVPSEPQALRDWLLALPGIGPKTASLITRNRTGTDDVAIIDVHVRRAGIAAGFFRSSWRLPRDYLKFELAFLGVARLGGVSAAALDAYIWDELQYLGAAAGPLLGRELAAFG